MLYTTEAQANQQLAQEGVAAERIRFVGNTLADALQIALRSKLATPNPRERLGLPTNLLNDRNGYGVVILDSAVNVGDRQVLAELINILRAVAHDAAGLADAQRTRELLASSKARCHRGQRAHRHAALAELSLAGAADEQRHLRDHRFVERAGEATILAVPCLTIGPGAGARDHDGGRLQPRGRPQQVGRHARRVGLHLQRRPARLRARPMGRQGGRTHRAAHGRIPARRNA